MVYVHYKLIQYAVIDCIIKILEPLKSGRWRDFSPIVNSLTKAYRVSISRAYNTIRVLLASLNFQLRWKIRIFNKRLKSVDYILASILSCLYWIIAWTLYLYMYMSPAVYVIRYSIPYLVIVYNAYITFRQCMK